MLTNRDESVIFVATVVGVQKVFETTTQELSPILLSQVQMFQVWSSIEPKQSFVSLVIWVTLIIDYL